MFGPHHANVPETQGVHQGIGHIDVRNREVRRGLIPARRTQALRLHCRGAGGAGTLKTISCPSAAAFPMSLAMMLRTTARPWGS